MKIAGIEFNDEAIDGLVDDLIELVRTAGVPLIGGAITAATRSKVKDYVVEAITRCASWAALALQGEDEKANYEWGFAELAVSDILFALEVKQREVKGVVPNLIPQIAYLVLRKKLGK